MQKIVQILEYVRKWFLSLPYHKSLMDSKKVLFALMTLSVLAVSAMADDPSTGEQINQSLMLLVGALPIVALAITSIVAIVTALIAVVIVVVLVKWFKDILMLPLDIVKGAIKGMH